MQEKKKKQSNGVGLVWIIVIVIPVISYIVYQLYPNSSPLRLVHPSPPPPKSPKVPVSAKSPNVEHDSAPKVPERISLPRRWPPADEVNRRQHWNSHADFVSEVISRGVPVVFSWSPATVHWEAMKWTPEVLSRKIDKPLSVFEGQGSLFTYSKGHMVTYSEGKVLDMNEVYMEPSQFFDAIQDNTDDYYYFYWNRVERMPGNVSTDTQPNEFFHTRMLPGDESRTSVWIGEPGCITQCHYDKDHNFYVQVYGRKRFVLYPPSAFLDLHLFPYFHDMHRSSQVNFTDISAQYSRYSAEHTGRVEVVLSPGETMYLPPYWFHHVETLDVSISLNTWSSPQDDKWIKLINQEFCPLQPQWDQFEITSALALYIRDLYNYVVRENRSLYGFLHDVIESRYTALSPEDHAYQQILSREDTIRKLCPHRSTLDETLHASDPPFFDMNLQRMGVAFDRLSDIGVRDIIFVQTMERKLEKTMEMSQVSSFLRFCVLDEPSTWNGIE